MRGEQRGRGEYPFWEAPSLPLAPSWRNMPICWELLCPSLGCTRPHPTLCTNQGLTEERWGSEMGWPTTPAGGSEKVLSQQSPPGQQSLQLEPGDPAQPSLRLQGTLTIWWW